MRRIATRQRQKAKHNEAPIPITSPKTKPSAAQNQAGMHPMLQMQRSHGNRYVQRMVNGQAQRNVMDDPLGSMTSLFTGMLNLPGQALTAMHNYSTETFLQQLDAEMANPAGAAQANELLDSIKLARQHAGYLRKFQFINLNDLRRSVDGIPEVPDGLLKGEENALTAITKSAHALSLVEKILTFTDSDMRGRWVNELKAEMLRSRAGHLSVSMDLFKFGVSTVNEIVSLSSYTLHGIAIITKNKDLAAKAAKYIGFADDFAKVAVPMADVFQVIGGIAKMVDPKDVQQAIDGMVDTTTGGLSLFGTLAPRITKNATVGAWATRANALGLALTITYEEFKFLGKEIYSGGILKTTWHGVNSTYGKLNDALQDNNEHFTLTQKNINDFEGADAMRQMEMMQDWNYLLPNLNYNAQGLFNLGAYGLKDYPYISVYFERMKSKFANKLEMAVQSLQQAQAMQDPFMFWMAAIQTIDVYKILVQILVELMEPENQKDIVKKQMRYFATKYGSGRNAPDLSDLYE